MKEEDLTGIIIGCAMKVHRDLGNGFLESVYQNALAHEIGKAGVKVECEIPLRVVYDGVIMGEFAADMLVNGKVIVENKAVQKLCSAHEVQLVNYLILNFGAPTLEFKRKYRFFRDHHPVNPVNPV